MHWNRAHGIILATCLLASCGQSGSPADASAPQTDSAETPAVSEAAWSLETEASRISFVSIKAGELIETHYFSGLSGQISPDGNAEITIPLDEVETKIDLRNERMRDMFFETDRYPVATIRAEVDPDTYSDLAVGARRSAEIEGVLSLHGADATVFANVFVTRVASNRVEISSAEPVVLVLSDFNLDAGLEALREIANLPSITPASPVTFTFMFEAAPG
ncbi:YceI family protein [Henriciella sp. AS95]|uniref:YceI family protein n=1 Tax=Henriciella sp. AS95 TaxID=3135782 RepID=UPI003173F280